MPSFVCCIAGWPRLVREMAGELRPELLLFLRRVTRLEFRDALTGVHLALTRRLQADGTLVVSLQQQGNSASAGCGTGGAGGGACAPVEARRAWLCVRHEMQPGVGRKGAAPGTTVLEVAFPIPEVCIIVVHSQVLFLCGLATQLS